MNDVLKKRQMTKTAAVYLAVSILCVVFDRVYAVFSHGVASAAMNFMFLYPLAGGALFFFLLRLFFARAGDAPHYRVSYNLYNSGISALVVRNLLAGIFEIAGTGSPYTSVFAVCGFGMITAAVIIFISDMLQVNRNE
jgi:hypothetical protein